MRASRKNHKRIPRIQLSIETLLFLWRAFGVVPKVKTGMHRVTPLARMAISRTSRRAKTSETAG
jgi:hypothetical protein